MNFNSFRRAYTASGCRMNIWLPSPQPFKILKNSWGCYSSECLISIWSWVISIWGRGHFKDTILLLPEPSWFKKITGLIHNVETSIGMRENLWPEPLSNHDVLKSMHLDKNTGKHD
jgi:hypothetical protein